MYPVVCGNTAEELFYKTRSTSRGIPTLLCVLIMQRTFSTRQGAPVGWYLPCCVWQYCRGALLQEKEHQEYTYPVVCVNSAEELFYKTRSTSRVILTLLCVLILQRSPSTRQGAPVGVYVPCCINTAEELFYKTRSNSRRISTLLCGNTAEELFYKTRSNSGSISTLLCVVILQRSSSTRQRAPVGVYLPCFV